jgi:hypothetical protein
MRRISGPVFSAALAFLLVGCGHGGDDVTQSGGASTATQVGNIRFDSGLTGRERVAFVEAMGYLDGAGNVPVDQTLLDYMKVPSFDPSSVRRWLEDRVQYILPDDTSDARIFNKVQANYTSYENPGVLPPAVGDNNHDDSGGHVVMANIGALVYLYGKKDQALYGVRADGIGMVSMTSPRVGVLETGDGLFIFDKYASLVPTAIKIFHLTTLIHESRHSDGNGVTAGFLHDKCVRGDFAGQNACDHNRNGPYEIEAMSIKGLMNSCGACSEKDRTVLKLLYTDAADRLVDDGQTTVWDDAPEGRR